MTGTRVPFALIGVLLLVASGTFAGSLTAPNVSGPTVDDALDRAAAETQSAVRDAVTTAARATARNPIVTPAATAYGDVLNDSGTLRDSLRVRIYLAVRERLRRLSGPHGERNVTFGLPATTTPHALRVAKRRVTVERAGSSGNALRATVEDVAIVVRRDGREVGRRTLSPTVTVPVPTLTVHDRVAAFEHRLNSGPAESGLGGKLTARLYALGWIRGYAQWGGTPIENVVSNRHLGVITNGAVLEMQRTHFGQSDPRGRSMLALATLHAAFTDVIGGTDNPVTERIGEQMARMNTQAIPARALERAQTDVPAATPEDTTTIGINDTADEVFLVSAERIHRQVRNAYTVDIERRISVDSLGSKLVERARPPRVNWTLTNTSRTTRTTVDPRAGVRPALDGPWHYLDYHARLVERTTTVRRTYATPNGTRTTERRRRRRFAIDVALVGRHDNGTAPVRPFERLHEPGGPLSGPNLQDVRRRASERLLGEYGGVDAVARNAVESGGGGTVEARIVADRPEGIDAWVYRDLVSLRDRVRNVSVTVRKGDLATLRVNPAAKLHEKLVEGRNDFAPVPDRYSGVAARARAGVLQRYLDTVRDRLALRAYSFERRRGSLSDHLDDTDGVSLESVRRGYRNRDSSKASPAGGGLDMRVQTSPSYLTLTELSGDEVAGIPEGTTEYPLAVRNFNVFTAPYGDAADAVAKALLGPSRTRLRTAATVLAAASDGGRETKTVRKIRDSVDSSLDYLSTKAMGSLATLGHGDIHSRSLVVNRALMRWNNTSARALAMTNGSAARAVTGEATAYWNLTERERDTLAVQLRVDLADARTDEAARPKEPPVSRQSARLKTEVRTVLAEQVANVSESVVHETIDSYRGKSTTMLPAGLPITPLPGAWFGTINYWEVQVRGEYARFTVSVPRGTPDDPGGRLLYVRDGRTVSLDVDGDGTRERLGTASRVSFRTHSSVAVAVPPGNSGVGDVDGQMEETSPGWPNPGR